MKDISRNTLWNNLSNGSKNIFSVKSNDINSAIASFYVKVINREGSVLIARTLKALINNDDTIQIPSIQNLFYSIPFGDVKIIEYDDELEMERIIALEDLCTK